MHPLRSMPVVEVKSDFLRLAVHFWERNRVPALHVEVQLLVGNLIPSSLKQVERMDVHLRWVL